MRKRPGLLWLCFLCIFLADTAYALTGDEVISLVDKHEDGYVDLSANIEMILTDTLGNSNVRKLRFYSIESENIGEKRKFVFRQPKDIRGTAILIHSMVVEEDKQWIYLPAFKRVKRVTSKNRQTPFIGSQFSYEDLASQEKEKYKNEFLYEKIVDGVPCYVVKRTPIFPASGYKHLFSYVDKQRARLIKTDYFDQQDKILKTLRIDGYNLYLGRFLIASIYTMKDHQANKTTVMKWTDIKLQSGLSPSDFKRSSLARAR